MPSTPQQLMDGASCLEGCLSGMESAVTIALLQKWAGTSLTPQQLVTNAACFESCVSSGMRDAMMIAELNRINGL